MRTAACSSPSGPKAKHWRACGNSPAENSRRASGPEAALIRELDEELGIAVKEACLAPLAFASHAYPEFHLLMPLWICRRWDGFVTSREGQGLRWVRPGKLRDYPMPPADAPLIPPLIDLLGP